MTGPGHTLAMQPRHTPGSVVLDTPAYCRGTSNPAIELRTWLVPLSGSTVG